MDLKNRKITLGEIMKNPRAEAFIGKVFPELMNPFLLPTAKKMNLENILKCAGGPNAQEKVANVISRLEEI